MQVSIYSTVLPLLTGLLSIFCGRMRGIKLSLLLLVLLSILTEMLTRQLRFQGDWQQVVYYLYTICEYALLAYIFALVLPPFIKKRTLLASIVVFALFVVIDGVGLSGLEQFNGYSTAIEALLLVFFALTFFYKTLTELLIKHLEQEPPFWVSTGVLLYFSSSLFIFLFTNYMAASNEALFLIWAIHGVFNITLNIFYSLALWVIPNP